MSPEAEPVSPARGGQPDRHDGEPALASASVSRAGLAWAGALIMIPSVAFGVGFVVHLVITGDGRAWFVVASSSAGAVVAYVGLRALRRGEVRRAVLVWAAGIAAIAVYLVALAPSLGPVAAVMLITTLALALPHVETEHARRLPWVAGALVLIFSAERALVADHGLLDPGIVRVIDLVSFPLAGMLCCVTIGYAIRVFGALRAGRAVAVERAQASARALAEAERRASIARSAQRNAEIAARAQSSFLANMSHEIRTPMNAVIGATGLLNRASLDARQKELVDTIQATADHLLGIINDILDLSKLDAGKVALKTEPFEIVSCVEQATDLVAHLATEKGLDLTYSIDDDVPERVVSDVARVRQILVNLLSNAVKFTDRGEVLVHVGLPRDSARPAGEHREGDTVDITFSVRDTGIGLTAEEQQRLFQPFTQANATTTATYGGTGLGLVLSKRLAEALGGTMQLTSVKGKGSTFTFGVRATVASPSAHQVDASPLEGLSVVIADDSRAQRELIAHMVTEWGMIPIPAETATAGLELVARRAPAAVIMGRRLRNDAGKLLDDSIREDPRCEGIPVIFAGSEPLSEEAARAFAAKVRKPVKRSALRGALLEVVGVARPSTTGGRDGDPTLGIRCPLAILLADDNPVNRKIALYMLEALGYSADAVDDGAKAHRAVIEGAYDLVLMDLHMPVLDGAEAARRIRVEVKPTDRPRIVGLTAAVLDDEQALVAETMDGFLPKPVTLAALLATLRATRPLARSVERRALAAEAAFSAASERLGEEQLGAEADALSRDVQRAIAELETAAESLDPRVLLELAGSLRARAESLGATAVASELRALEVRGRKRTLKGLRGDLRSLGREMASFRARASRPRAQG